MRVSSFERLRNIAEVFLKEDRFPTSSGAKRIKNVVKGFLREKGVPFREEIFQTEVNVPKKVEVRGSFGTITADAFLGSSPCKHAGYVKEEPVKGDIALVSWENLHRLENLTEKGVRTFFVTSPFPLKGYVEEDLSVFSLGEEYVALLKDSYVEVRLEVKREKLLCSNLVWEIGRGPIVYVVAHMDTFPGVHGAVDNGSSVLLLFLLTEELLENYNIPFKVRFLLTDAHEIGLKGALFHTSQGLKNAFYCINLDCVGWKDPAILYKDPAGYNSEELTELFFLCARDVGLEARLSSSHVMGDHVPFKEMGVKTLFLGAGSFPLRHTPFDIYDIVDWHLVRLWYDALLLFLKRLGRW
ncbi:peptidase M28 [Thermocrinis albus DSM 14484]|uniref:Peptidase M28 n=1 Tax=Thermocrinis albus (strain DSM 14484 / JCM 11386 / HI 11/12) TaxID=638303 RepID=D3SPL8_THEAH|nr:M28 family peptidase [Thermocrinis albus]ADC89105.1 peptidase M28 [Thermocrinis albus DSM 14484]